MPEVVNEEAFVPPLEMPRAVVRVKVPKSILVPEMAVVEAKVAVRRVPSKVKAELSIKSPAVEA